MDEFLTSTFGQLSYVVLLCLVVASIVVWIYRRVTARHHSAMDVARFLTSWGFQRLPRALENYALSDYPAAAREMKEVSDILQDPVKRKIEFAGLFKRMLEEAAKDPASRLQISEVMATYAPPVALVAAPLNPALKSAA